MFKTLSAAALVSIIALVAPAATATAKTNINLDFGLNLGGGYAAPGYDAYPVYDPEPEYVDACSEARMSVKYHGFKKVQPVDCSAPTFAFKARKNGNWWVVRTNVYGNIKSVQPL